jgi:hypothetical protein
MGKAKVTEEVRVRVPKAAARREVWGFARERRRAYDVESLFVSSLSSVVEVERWRGELDHENGFGVGEEEVCKWDGRHGATRV